MLILLSKMINAMDSKMSINNNDELLTTEQAAEILKFSPGTLSVWRAKTKKEGKLKGPPFRQSDNGDIRYVRSELDAWSKEFFKEYPEY